MALPADPEADFAIVGAGAAGALFAARLAAAGRKVVVLEAGPGWTQGDLQSSQIWSRRLKWGGAPVLRGGTDPIGYNMAVGWGLGGSALHHYAGYPRLFEADFRMASEHGRGLDWPFDYAELRPWYDRVQAEIGISGDAAQEPWRPPAAPYPMPPLKSFAQGEILKRGFAAERLRVAPAPAAITSIAYKDRPACLYDGWCDAGCPIGALFNPLVAHLPAAIQHGAVIRSGAAVTRIAIDGGGRAYGVIYRANGAERLQPARTIILAGGAVQNARLLLSSAGPKHPQGLGGGQGLIGRYFAAHMVVNGYGLFPQPTEPHRGVAAPGLVSYDDYAKPRSGNAFGSVGWGAAPAIKPNDLLGLSMTRPELHGPALDGFLRRAATSIGSLSSLAETVPNADNRIELAAERDANGMPLARPVHSLGAEARALFADTRARSERILRAAGATEAWTPPMIIFAHPAGGAVMGANPARSVTNGYGQLHEAANVVVAGGALFPTIGAVSPTFTILALAERTAARIIAMPGSFTA